MTLENAIKIISPQIDTLVKQNYGHKNIVIGEGNIDSSLLIIGEAMGKNEEKYSRIFIGPSGLLLRNTLSKFLIHNFFIINTLPIRPINNRTPNINEIKLFSQCYNEIIKLSQFKQILALGKCAKYLIQHLGYQNFISTYHPAYLLYNRYNKTILDEFESNFKILSDNLDISKPNQDTYVIFTI
jgi:uracil-DNA glycosylase